MGFIMISAIEQKSYFILLYTTPMYTLHLVDLHIIHLGEIWKDHMSSRSLSNLQKRTKII
jgi:hypothetical protein